MIWETTPPAPQPSSTFPISANPPLCFSAFDERRWEINHLLDAAGNFRKRIYFQGLTQLQRPSLPPLLSVGMHTCTKSPRHGPSQRAPDFCAMRRSLCQICLHRITGLLLDSSAYVSSARIYSYSLFLSRFFPLLRPRRCCLLYLDFILFVNLAQPWFF